MVKRLLGIIFAVCLVLSVTPGTVGANAVDWNGGFVEADGYGIPPVNAYNPVQGRILAKRAAIVDAQRNLLETIAGVHVNAETTIQNAMVSSDIVKTGVAGIIRGAVIVSDKQMADGTYKITLRVPLYGVQGLQKILPEIDPGMETINLPLSKKFLEKPGDTAELTSNDITINLNWYRSRKGSIDEGEKVDLDLGFFGETMSGRKCVIDQLNANTNGLGAFEQSPYAELTADDRSGNSVTGETIRINGKRIGDIKRFLVYSYIYAGVPNWGQVDGVVTIKQPGKPDIIIKLDAAGSDERTCAIATIENDGTGKFKLTRAVQYYHDREPMDRAFNWGFNWIQGTK
jgi:uncharacterized protein involved in tellurium resistance